MTQRISAFLVKETSYGIFSKVPIWVYSVNEDEIFPVKFEYKQRSYRGLRFSETINHIQY